MRFLALFVSFLFACESSCVKCHPKLQKLYQKDNKLYKEHYFLKDCTKCHKDHKSGEVDKCGADCFDCHSREKVISMPIKEHQKLRSCVKCHGSEKILDILNGF
jgi:hypothetical protein